MMRRLQEYTREFQAAVLTWRGVRDQGGGTQVAISGAAMTNARQRALAWLDETERVMREELAAL